MNIVFLTGAGISKESGIRTFRDSDDGIWNEYSIEEVATLGGWRNDRSNVIDFYTLLKERIDIAQPNNAHNFISELEKENSVTVITQNIDDLHERSGSTNVIHVHGSINEVQSSLDPKLKYSLEEVGIEEGYISIGSKCEKGSQLRPSVVWFGEGPNHIHKCYDCIEEADLFVTIGTSFNVNTASSILSFVDKKTKKILIDPSNFCDDIINIFDKHIQEKASTGVDKLKTIIQ